MLPQFWPDVKHCQGLFNQIGQQLILAIVGVCATICITLLRPVLLSTSPPWSAQAQAQRHCGVLCPARDFVYGNETGRGMWSDYGAESSPGAAFIQYK